MIIDKRRILWNHSSRHGKKVEYIVVHDTGNANPGADALAHYRYFNGGNRNASAHYFVDDQGIVELVEQAESAWHCGDGKGRKGITNRNSIGIELCIHPGNDMKKTYDYALLLIRQLLTEYGLSKARVVRHFDASGKICPGHMAKNQWALWWGFWESI